MSKTAAAPSLRLRGVRHHNLKNFDLDLPLGKLIVVTGLSGSGKSSLAFDTLFAEGQRRYIETFSPYARQFFDRMDKPQVDRIEGIPPAIAIEQRNAVKTTRSSVGTMTEICDYAKVLWANLAQLHCRKCGQPVQKDSPQAIWENVKLSLPPSRSSSQSPAKCENEERGRLGEILITFHLPLSEKLSLEDSLALIAKQGYQRLLIGNEIVRLENATSHFAQNQAKPAALTVAQDKLPPMPENRARFMEACEQAYHFGQGKLTLHFLAADSGNSKFKTQNSKLFSNRFHCAPCDLDYREPSPARFSFNHPLGACPTCKGFGRTITIDYNLAIPDRTKTLAGGAVKPWQTGQGAECQQDLAKFCKLRKVPMDVPFEKLSDDLQSWVLHGDPDYGQNGVEWPKAWYGVKGYFRWLESKSYKMHVRVLLSRYRSYTTCPDCAGTRFQPETLLYKITLPDNRKNPTPQSSPHSCVAGRGGEMDATDKAPVIHRPSPIHLADFYQLSLKDAFHFIEALTASRPPGKASDPLTLALHEVRSRLGYLNEVGLGYLTLDRPTRTLSGGETERVNLTTCLGSGLVNTLFVLDEPTVGLHPRDTDHLVKIMQRLRDAGNTVLVVEHEPSVMRAADHIVDLGPGHGASGGDLVFQGSFPEILQSPTSLTGQYLSGKTNIAIPQRRVAKRTANTLVLNGASLHNLKNVSVAIPLGRFVGVTGVSGSGKSTLVRDCLRPALEAKLRSAERGLSENVKSSLAAETPSRENENNDGEDEQNSALPPPPAALQLQGWENLGRVLLVDQSPIGRTPRSNPAVYIGAFDDLRELFAQTELARQRGLNASAFSFNSAQGQCERCRGAGFEKIEMQFLSDVFVRCPECEGKRYRAHILEVKVSGVRCQAPSAMTSRLTPDTRHLTLSWSIADLLDASVDAAIAFLAQLPATRHTQRAAEKLGMLQEVGLGYLKLGQPINTLSGGESQRLKLVSHLAELSHAPSLSKNVKPTLFLFDEPTTGLHFEDVRILIQAFQRLVDSGHSVLVIEHNLELIQCVDWIIDLGPDAGNDGGQIVTTGTPEAVAQCSASHTGRALADLWQNKKLPAAGGTNRRPGQSKLAKTAHPDVLRPGRSIPRPMPPESGAICIHGAREHNLKNLSLTIPRGQFIVITGVSGSGKSTLAFDLLFAEGQRRFLDSMNVYARQFVEQLSRPEVDLITGLPPTVSIEQRNSRGGGKSTVATVTEIYHFIRLLFARLGTQFCPACAVPVAAQTRDEVARKLQTELKQRGNLRLLAPVVRNRKGFHTDVAEWATKHGYREIRADGKIVSASERLRLDRFREHDVEIVVGVLEGSARPRRADRGVSLRSELGETPRLHAGRAHSPQQLIDEALQLGHGTLFALGRDQKATVHSLHRACPKCKASFAQLDPKNFSYNSAQGWCPTCRGFGELFYLPEDVDRGARADAIEESWFNWQEGKRELCPDCQGSRLNPLARAVRLTSANSKLKTQNSKLPPTMVDIGNATVAEALTFFQSLKFTGREAEIARDILPEIHERLKFLGTVGLGYLQLGRSATTLSGGEAQRIRLAAQLGSNLTGVLYVLDEPTIGLHARDNERLLAALERLQQRGNSLMVVEHDDETMRRADHVIDLGPGAGVRGGEVVAAGTLAELMEHPDSLTGQCLREKKKFPARGERRPVQRAVRTLVLSNAARHNLQNVTVAFPLHRFVAVSGVSGSGKSTLIRECLLPALQSHLAKNVKSSLPAKASKAKVMTLDGWQNLHAVHEVDQSPIGRTPRSIPATYVGFFDDIRQLFAQIPEAKMRGYSASRFSFNSAQGRCPECEGAGVIKLEMNFLPPALVKCEACLGRRFNRETLDIEFRGKNIAQVLALSVAEALEFFSAFPKIRRALEALHDTGLDYLQLGQPSPTLSGGEAQRLKLVAHLLAGWKSPAREKLPGQRAATKPTAHFSKAALFILEEPTIGLHLADVRKLVAVLQRLVDAGHSVIVIEHHLDLLAEADWVIDLGPEGGDAGGKIIGAGTPEMLAQNKKSLTGRFLRKVLPKKSPSAMSGLSKMLTPAHT